MQLPSGSVPQPSGFASEARRIASVAVPVPFELQVLAISLEVLLMFLGRCLRACFGAAVLDRGVVLLLEIVHVCLLVHDSQTKCLE